jgi:UDP-N-acetylglucosamine--N-acetylmuramyl-(pentapeptide) pyrophosphoryl-undecaprenol N-acetylglucosamine transferase
MRAAGLEVSCFVGREVASMLYDVGEVWRIDTCGPGARLPQRFAARVHEDISRLRHVRPDVVVSDGDGPSIHAALALGIPSVAVGHGVLYATCHIEAPLPRLLRVREALNAASSTWCATRRVVVHFAPARPFAPGTRVARPDLSTALSGTPSDDGSVLAYFRDDDGYPWLEHLATQGERVVLFGNPRRVPAGVTVHRPDAESFAEHLLRCRGVISSAGNHLPAECALLGKPLLATFARHDAEHRMNAALIESARIGVAAPIEHAAESVVQRWRALAQLGPCRSPIHDMRPASTVVTEAVLDLVR